MRISRLVLSNFLTYETLDYMFRRTPVQVQGENRSQHDQKSNGACKSGIINAIEFALTGSCSRGVRDVELINFDATEAHIYLYVDCHARSETLCIHWVIKSKGSNILEVNTRKFKSEELLPLDYSTVNDGKKVILEWLAISKDDLFNYYIITRERFKSFFKASNKENTELIARFTDAQIIEDLDKSVDSEVERLESLINKLKSDDQRTEAQIEVHRSNIEKELNRDVDKEILTLESDLNKRIEIIEKENALAASDIKEQYKKLEFVDKDTESLKLAVDVAKQAVDSFQLTDFDQVYKELEKDEQVLKTDFKATEAELKDWKEKKVKLESAIANLSRSLMGLIICPKCGYEWDESEKMTQEVIAENKIKLSQQKQLIPKLEQVIQEHQEQCTTVQQDINTLSTKIQVITKTQREENASLRELQSALSVATVKIESIEGQKKRIQKAIDELNSDIQCSLIVLKQLNVERGSLIKPSINKIAVKTWKKEIEDLEASILTNQARIYLLSDELLDLNAWKVNFKKFKLYVANQSLGVIQNHMNFFLKEMGSDMRIRIDGYKYLANGDIKDDISPVILRERERTFGSFSGGEKGRLIFASILGNKHMIDKANPYGGLDFLGLDEVFEAVDAVGISHIMKSVKNFDCTMLIITHVSDEFLDSDTIKVVKENERSFIVAGEDCIFGT